MNFDMLVHIAAPGRTSTSKFDFLSHEDVIIKGRCRDHSALMHNHHSVDMGVAANFRFVCIRYLLPPAHDVPDHTLLLLNGLSVARSRSTGVFQVERLVQQLAAQSQTTNVILCSDTVEQETIQILSRSGVYLVSNISLDIQLC